MFAKGYTPNWSEEVFVINDLNGEEITGTFYEKELQKIKVIKKKGGKLYVRWKGYDNSFNGWIDKKDLV